MEKPSKPRPDFPLFPHQNGQWAKKIKGKLYYFGTWADPEDAESRFKAFLCSPVQKKVVEKTFHALRLKDLSNLYLTDVARRVKNQEISISSLKNYQGLFKRFFKHTSKLLLIHEVDWSKAARDHREGLSPLSWKSAITHWNAVFRWAVDNDLLESLPDLGPEWKKPDRKTIRRTSKQYKIWFAADEIRSMLDHCAKTSKLALRAMILLGVGSGLGNHDCASLRPQNIDLARGWLLYPRPKTGVQRRSKLWPETIAALRAYQETRPDVDLDLVFVTQYGNKWTRPDEQDCAINREFRKVMKACGCYVAGRGFYGLRRTCATIGGESGDLAAVNLVMGHLDESTAAIYRQAISDTRLERVSETIRTWLFPQSP
jgi:integrase